MSGVKRRGLLRSASSTVAYSAAEHAARRRVLSVLGALAFVFAVLGILAGMTVPLFLASGNPQSNAYATSSSIGDAPPVAVEATPAAAETTDTAAQGDPQAEVVDAQSAEPPVTPGDPSGGQPTAAAAQGAASAAAAAAAAATAGSSGGGSKGTVTIITFGYDFGSPPSDCKFVADVRDIDAGSFSQSETGLMPSVIARVMATGAAQAWFNVFQTEWIPAMKSGDTVAIGCAKGHHRSVALGVLLANELTARGYTVNLVHRDILKGW